MTDHLEHHGVLGMKWGVRKQRRSSGTRKSSSSGASKLADRVKAYSTNRKRKKALVKARKVKAKNQKKNKSNNVKKLTNEELQKRIDRLTMEKQYKNLSRDTMSRGRKLVEDIAYDSIKNIGTQAVTYGFGTAFNKVMKSEIVNPKKGQKDK